MEAPEKAITHKHGVDCFGHHGDHALAHSHGSGRFEAAMLWGSLVLVCLGLFVVFAQQQGYGFSLPVWLSHYGVACYRFFFSILPGLLLGTLAVSFIAQVPSHWLEHCLGKPNSVTGIVRAMLAGLLMDGCSHGVLMVGVQLYKKGASLGQLMAFLIATPWNSLSLTLVLFGLIGLPWTFALMGASALVAFVTGYVCLLLERAGLLPASVYKKAPSAIVDATLTPIDFKGLPRLVGKTLVSLFLKPKRLLLILSEGWEQSQLVWRWGLFGIVLASAIQAFVPLNWFQAYFGASLAGLGFTLLAATLMEVCSEGATPFAADLMLRAHAPGNMFAFLMAGVSTDMTELLVVKELTSSWRLALLLPLLTLPQIVFIAWLMNTLS